MAKTTGALSSIAASGSVGEVCYSTTKTRAGQKQTARQKPRKSGATPTAAQVEARRRMAAAMKSWAKIGNSARSWWKWRANLAGKQAVNYYAAEHINQGCAESEEPKRPAA